MMDTAFLEKLLQLTVDDDITWFQASDGPGVVLFCAAEGKPALQMHISRTPAFYKIRVSSGLSLAAEKVFYAENPSFTLLEELYTAARRLAKKPDHLFQDVMDAILTEPPVLKKAIDLEVQEEAKAVEEAQPSELDLAARASFFSRIGSSGMEGQPIRLPPPPEKEDKAAVTDMAVATPHEVPAAAPAQEPVLSVSEWPNERWEELSRNVARWD